MDELSRINLKWRVIHAVTAVVADKINQITGTHDTIVTRYLEGLGEDVMANPDKWELGRLEQDVADFVKASGIWDDADCEASGKAM